MILKSSSVSAPDLKVLYQLLTLQFSVGGGQSGVHVAARFKQMNIPTLVVEKNQRIGHYLLLTLITFTHV